MMNKNETCFVAFFHNGKIAISDTNSKIPNEIMYRADKIVEVEVKKVLKDREGIAG